MEDIDNVMFSEWMDLADSDDEASIHSLWMEYGYDHETGTFMKWCSTTDKLVPIPREQWPDFEVLNEDDEDWEGCYERD
ncbi:MAG: hypothetical protein JJU29_17855 [Verrucomicrobia bacterium]|nr:hypothetical protein [Verrucomicrobiota bacterium]MCH8513881.1 hypothetical protein [Kiritimatiellia bacterium]